MNEREPQRGMLVVKLSVPTEVFREEITEHRRKAIISLVVAGVAAGVNPVAGIIMLTETAHQMIERHSVKNQLQRRLDQIEQDLRQKIQKK